MFLNASTIATAALLLNSKSHRFPNGFGNASDQVGRNLMDHYSGVGASGEHDSFRDMYYKGRRPCGFYIPRFRNLPGEKEKLPFTRGYGIQGHGERKEWMDKSIGLEGVGRNYKEQLTTPGNWTVWMAGWGECLPYADNRITLDEHAKDNWGMPTIRVISLIMKMKNI